MDDYADIYYVDTDPRNARDHRRPGTSGAAATGFASGLPWRPMAPTRTVYVPPQAQAPIAHQAPIVYQPVAPQYQAPMYQAPIAQQSPFGNLFGKLTSGQVIELVAQLFAALQPLPAAPTPTRNGDTDSGNLILFQDALAKHAKRDEQVRTVGSLVSKLVG